MNISFSRPLDEAVRESAAILFGHCGWRRWLALALLAWLSVLGFLVANAPLDTFTGGRISHWVEAHVIGRPTFFAIVGAGVAAIALLLAWVRARALLAFLECMVRREGRASEAWARQARAGLSLFLARFAVGTGAALMVAAAAAGWLFWFRAREADWGALAADDALVLGIAVAIVAIAALALGVATCLIDDFLSAFLLSGRRAGDAVATLAGLIRRRAAIVLTYVGVRFGMALLAVSVVLIIGLLSCGLAFLPYIGAIILLPVHATWRLYPLFFLRQIDLNAWGEDSQPMAGYPPVLDAAPQTTSIPPRLAPPRLPSLPQDPGAMI